MDPYNPNIPARIEGTYWLFQAVYRGLNKVPMVAKSDSLNGPSGPSQTAAVMSPKDKVAKKMGKILSPSPEPGHRTFGWLSTPQIFPAAGGGWFGMFNGSITPPASVEKEPAMR